MKLSTKHANQQRVEYQDFTGGLNTTSAIEQIQPNELNKSVNFELMGNLLKTVSGTTNLYTTDDLHFTDMFYDSINDLLIVTTTDKGVYTIKRDGTELTQRGTLTGSITPGFAIWDLGVLIASGGQLQYWNGTTLETIDTSPTVCNGVFVSHGRAIVYYDTRLHYSAVGDVTGWTDDTGDDSSSKWQDVGYKDGGAITGVTNLSSDLIVFKNNDAAWHVANQYPDWTQNEISRNIDDKSWRSCLALTNTALVLGRSTIHSIQPTDEYGDLTATNIASKIQKDVQALPSSVKLRYVAPLNQVWFLTGDKSFLFLDVEHVSYYRRAYNTAALDVCYHDDTVYVLKDNAICYLDNGGTMYDAGAAMDWSFEGKTMVSFNDYLVKRARVDVTPLFQNYCNIRFYVGSILLQELVPNEALQIYHDYTVVYHSNRGVHGRVNSTVYDSNEDVYDDEEEIYHSTTALKTVGYVRQDRRQVDRHKAIRVRGKGAGGRLILNLINFDLVEV